MKRTALIVCLSALCTLFLVSCGGDDPTGPADDNTAVSDDTGDSDADLFDHNDSDLPKDGDIPPSDGDQTGDEGDGGVDVDIPSAWDQQDEDGDGIPNGVEGTGDTDGDGTPDYQDTDTDGDGIPDSVEAPGGLALDTDNDDIPDYKDTDADNDGVPDGIEGTGDADGDGTTNYRDTDADGDGMPDGIECPAQPCVDSDGDGTADFLDTDSDGDGVPDLYEGYKDMDGDGVPSYLDDDSDGDGLLDSAECPAQPCVDSDGDTFPDFKDKDADNDGLPDAKEVELGTDPTKTDTDNDGVDDNTEVAAGSDPLVSDPGWWAGKYYVILPYDPGVEVPKTLDFNTALKKVDVLFMIDISGSMGGEISNLKSGILNTIIPGLGNLWPNDAQAVGYGLMTFGQAKSYDRVTQAITTVQSQINSAVNAIPSAYGGDEPTAEALYQAATGEGINGYFPPPACTAPDNRGGACFRGDSLPIFLMITDEDFTSDALILTHDRTAAINAMNAAGFKAKFIGINTYQNSSGCGTNNTTGPAPDYIAMSEGTQSYVVGSNPHQYFNYNISCDGSGLSDQIVNAVASLAGNVSMTVTTKKEKVELPESYDDPVNSADFIAWVKPKYTHDAGGTPVITCPSGGQCDDTSFYGVKPGTGVMFDIAFENHIYQPTSSESLLFKAKISVLGEGSTVDDRDVYVIVPGIIDDGGEN